MNDLEQYELDALDYASEMAGQYIESLGQTDLSKISSDEWLELIRVIAVNYHTKRAELQPCPF